MPWIAFIFVKNYLKTILFVDNNGFVPSQHIAGAHDVSTIDMEDNVFTRTILLREQFNLTCMQYHQIIKQLDHYNQKQLEINGCRQKCALIFV